MNALRGVLRRVRVGIGETAPAALCEALQLAHTEQRDIWPVR